MGIKEIEDLIRVATDALRQIKTEDEGIATHILDAEKALRRARAVVSER
jgi:hypothetical protein